MEITEVRVKLADDPNNRLRAFCTITFDHGFVVRDLKIIDGIDGMFVAMPARRTTKNCPNCGTKNHSRALFCNKCGSRTPAADGNDKQYVDLAHPINKQCREMIQKRVIDEFHRSKDAGDGDPLPASNSVTSVMPNSVPAASEV